MSRVLFLTIPILFVGACEVIAGIQPPIDGRDSSVKAGGDLCAPRDLDAGRDDCPEGTANCGAPSGCAVDLTQDEKNCGYCGHDCHDAGCEAGMCAPVVISYDTQVGDIALRGDKIYWGAAGMTSRISSAVIATGTPDNTWDNLPTAPVSLAIDDKYVYWTHHYLSCIGRGFLDGGIDTFELGGCHGSGSGRITVDATDVYWVLQQSNAACNKQGNCCDAGAGCCADAGTSCIMKVAKNENANVPTVLATSEGVSTAIAVDTEYVYWGDFVDGGVINRCPKSGCGDGGSAIKTLATNAGDPSDIVLDEVNHYLYWVDGTGGGVRRHSTTDSVGSDGDRIPSASSAAPQYSLALDETFVYWPQVKPGPIWSIARASKLPKQNSNASVDLVLTSALDVATDCENVYWSGADGGIYRVSK